MRYNGNISLGKRPTFHDVTTGFPAKWRLRNERRNSISITCHYLNLGSASDWLKQISLAARPIISTTHIWLVARHQYGISAFGPQTSFHGESGGVDGKGQLFSHATLTSVDVNCHLKSPYPQKNVLLRNFSLQFNGRFCSLCHRWQIENPGRCSARCGLGYQSRVVKCVRVHNDRWGEVLDKHCPSKTKPPLFVRCNGTCEGTKWVYSQWSKVSVVPVKRLYPSPNEN